MKNINIEVLQDKRMRRVMLDVKGAHAERDMESIIYFWDTLLDDNDVTIEEVRDDFLDQRSDDPEMVDKFLDTLHWYENQ